MPAPTPGYVKNVIRRSFREIVGPGPRGKDVGKIWDFFNSECAYCGKKLDRKNKEGHIDHLVSASLGGPNHISNRVLSCATCNEKEKSNTPWKRFLSQKISDKNLHNKRKKEILRWQRENGVSANRADIKIFTAIDSLANKVIEFYDQKVLEINAVYRFLIMP